MRINRVILETKNIEALASFYRTVLELPVIKKEGDFTVVVGNSIIQFQQTRETQEPLYHFAFTIPSNKIEEAREWLQQRVELIWIEDYKSVVADFVHWNAKSVYFFDAAGNILELIARIDLKNDRNEKFSSDQFLSISEIGLVFTEEEIEIKTNELLTQFQLSFFSRQPPSPNFKAIGNDEGLLIIVTENRKWYPTNKKSFISPIQLEFENFGKEYSVQF